MRECYLRTIRANIFKYRTARKNSKGRGHCPTLNINQIKLNQHMRICSDLKFSTEHVFKSDTHKRLTKGTKSYLALTGPKKYGGKNHKQSLVGHHTHTMTTSYYFLLTGPGVAGTALLAALVNFDTTRVSARFSDFNFSFSDFNF